MSAVEFDFFSSSASKAPPASAPPKLIHRKRSFRDIQNVISKINPEVLKTVIAHNSAATKSSENGKFSMPSTPKESLPAAFPVYNPNFRSVSGTEMATETAPMTFFYNGIVAVFDVPRDKAEKIIKLAEEGNSVSVQSTLHGGGQEDLPIARRKSLQRFLEKRKERLTVVSPYGVC